MNIHENRCGATEYKGISGRDKGIRGHNNFIAGLEIERENYDVLERLRIWAAGHDRIQQLYYVTGAVDMVAVILARDVADYDDFTARLMHENPLIRRITTNVVLRPLKTGVYVPPGEPVTVEAGVPGPEPRTGSRRDPFVRSGTAGAATAALCLSLRPRPHDRGQGSLPRAQRSRNARLK